MVNSIIGPESVKTQTDLGGQNQVTPASESEKTESLSTEESARLNELEEAIEGTIETGRAAIAQALKAIRDERLYRAEYSSFGAYVNDRWGYSRSHAYRLIDWANVIETSPAGDTPKTERQCRIAKAEVKAKVDDSPSAVLITGRPVIPKKEFKAFGKFVDRLLNGLAPFAYRSLLTQMRDHIDSVLAAKETEWASEKHAVRCCKTNDKKEVAA
jgi:hypothetical protein